MEQERIGLNPAIQLQNKTDSWTILSYHYDMPENPTGMYSVDSLKLLLQKSDRIQKIPKNALMKMRPSSKLITSLSANYLIALLESLQQHEGRPTMGWSECSSPPIDYICKCIDYLDENKKLDIWERPPQDFDILPNIGQE